MPLKYQKMTTSVLNRCRFVIMNGVATAMTLHSVKSSPYLQYLEMMDLYRYMAPHSVRHPLYHGDLEFCELISESWPLHELFSLSYPPSGLPQIHLAAYKDLPMLPLYR
jgi:hypothetical protein